MYTEDNPSARVSAARASATRTPTARCSMARQSLTANENTNRKEDEPLLSARSRRTTTERTNGSTSNNIRVGVSIEEVRDAVKEPLCGRGAASCCSIPYPMNTFRILFVEFCERFAFYGVVYSLFTFMTLMLGRSTSEANFIMNALYTASPFSAMAGAYLADGVLGRSRTLLLCAGTYTIGLVMTACSALPAMFGDFPTYPTVNNYAFFSVGLIFLGMGYGGLKTCTGPLCADQVTVRLWHAGIIKPPSPSIIGQQKSDNSDDANGGGAESGDGGGCDGKEDSDETATTEHVQGLVMASLFRLIYWVITVGSTGGILLCPFLRSANPNDPDIKNGDKMEPSGYYIPFWLCACLAFCGVVTFATGMRGYSELSHDQSSKIFAALFGSLWRWLRSKCCCGDSDANRSPTGEPAIDGTFLAHGVTKDMSTEAKQERLKILKDLRQSITACKAFFVLPLYWLLGNQYSTNFILQTSWMDRPSYLPPEAIHNVSTITSLLCIPLLDKVVFPFIYGKDRKPPTVPRMAIGFFCTVIAVSYGAFLQLTIEKRGYFDDSEQYHVHPDGDGRLSVWFQVPAYALQGISGCFVDITALEAAYVLAPASMKSLVVAVYWMCSGLSGLLGIFVSPLFKPSMFVPLFFSLAGILGVMTIVFMVVLRRLDDEVRNVAVATNDGAANPGQQDSAKQQQSDVAVDYE